MTGYDSEHGSSTHTAKVGFRFDDRSRLSLSLDHLSNAGLDDKNPGTEALVLTYAVPFSVFLGH